LPSTMNFSCTGCFCCASGNTLDMKEAGTCGCLGVFSLSADSTMELTCRAYTRHHSMLLPCNCCLILDICTFMTLANTCRSSLRAHLQPAAATLRTLRRYGLLWLQKHNNDPLRGHVKLAQSTSCSPCRPHARCPLAAQPLADTWRSCETPDPLLHCCCHQFRAVCCLRYRCCLYLRFSYVAVPGRPVHAALYGCFHPCALLSPAALALPHCHCHPSCTHHLGCDPLHRCCCDRQSLRSHWVQWQQQLLLLLLVSW
jgi:hypothetical protein